MGQDHLGYVERDLVSSGVLFFGYALAIFSSAD